MSKYVVYVKDEPSAPHLYERNLSDIKEQMKEWLDEKDKVIYLKSDYTNIEIMPQ